MKGIEACSFLRMVTHSPIAILYPSQINVWFRFVFLHHLNLRIILRLAKVPIVDHVTWRLSITVSWHHFLLLFSSL